MNNTVDFLHPYSKEPTNTTTWPHLLHYIAILLRNVHTTTMYSHYVLLQNKL